MKGKRLGWVRILGAGVLFALGAATASAQDDVQVYLDANLKAGYQGGAVVRAASGDVVTVELYATGITGAKGVSARVAYDAADLEYVSYKTSSLIAGGTGLVIQEAGGFLEIGTGSVLGAASAAEGRVATITFKVLGSPNGAEISTVEGLASVGGQTVTAAGGSTVKFYGAIPGSIALDADDAAGYQGSTVVGGVSAGKSFTVEIYGEGLAGMSGYSALLSYDSTALRYDGFTNGSAIPGLTGLDIEGSGSVEIGGASVLGSAGVAEAGLSKVRFTVLSGFKGSTSISLDASSLGGPAGQTILTPMSSILVTGTFVAKPGDFDGNGSVDFTDFIQFAQAFGSSNALYDLNSNGSVDFGDFVIFAQNFGK
jgi:hypothetical protein